MPDGLYQAVHRGLRTLQRVAGKAVTYRRGDASASITAVPAATELEANDRSGLITAVHVRDFLIVAEDVVLAGQLVEPAEGDRIEETDSRGRTLIHEVLSPGGSMEAWRFSDPGRETLRVHTKLIETLEAQA